MKAQSPRQPARTAKPARATAQPSAKKAPPAQSASKLKVARKVKAAPAKAAALSSAPTPTRKPAVTPPAVSTAKGAPKTTPPKAAAAATSASRPPATEKVEATSSVPPPSAQKRRKSIKEAAGVSTDAVARRTGKSWDDWFDVLDSAGAATLDQRGIVAILAQKHGIGPWWQQMIAVGYDSLRSKSDKPPAADGFHVSSSCTLEAPVARVFKMWNDAGERARWLADDRFVVRGATADKVIRARWGKGTSHVAVSLSEKGGRTEVSVAHHQIETSAAAEQMKAYWAKKLSLLEQALEPPR